MIKVAAITLLILLFPQWAYADRDFPCSLVVAHEPAPGTAFEPGVDVSGQPVAQADLNTIKNPIPDVIKVPLTIDLIQQLEGADLPEGAELDAPVALVEIHRSGGVRYNGQDISGDVEALCAIDKSAVDKRAVVNENAAAK